MSDDQTPSRYELAPRQALASLSMEARKAWHGKYLAQDGAEPRVLVLLEKAETSLRATGNEATIRTLWMALADKAVEGNDPDLRAAAALAGMALGLYPS